MTAIQIFENPEFGTFDVAIIDGKAHIEATPCAQALGYERPHDAISRHCRYSVKHGVPHPQSPGKTIEKTFIPEGDLYRLIVRSHLPEAERFERWVFDEILPTINRTGTYSVAPLSGNELVLAAVQHLQSELGKEKELRLTAEARIEADKPKVLFADSVSVSKSEILVGELAKILHQNGVEIGQNRLFERLRNEGYLCKTGMARNTPTQRAQEMGLFRIKETAVTHSDGHVTTSLTPKVTGKGQVYFVNHFLGKKEGRDA